ncbi:hypothetical protein HZB00_02700 [Candidatus Woesearchaeota archaeon]|nr:hypothetical protein [Candidatus Woesearchaeota archaeon]
MEIFYSSKEYFRMCLSDKDRFFLNTSHFYQRGDSDVLYLDDNLGRVDLAFEGKKDIAQRLRNLRIGSEFGMNPTTFNNLARTGYALPEDEYTLLFVCRSALRKGIRTGEPVILHNLFGF